MSMSSLADKTGRSVIYIKKVACLNSVKVGTRSKKLFKTEKEEIKALAEMGESAITIAEKFECSVGAIEQIVSQVPGIVERRKRIRFIKTRNKHRSIIQEKVKECSHRTDIQKAARTAYTWLFQNDKEWLNATLPPAIPRKVRYRGT